MKIRVALLGFVMITGIVMIISFVQEKSLSQSTSERTTLQDQSSSAESSLNSSRLELPPIQPDRFKPGARVIIENHVFKVPSLSHENVPSSKKTTYSMDELMLEYWDDELQQYVSKLKNLEPGDSVILQNKLSDVRYNPVMKATFLTFDSEREEKISWSFNGDLTERFRAGDNLALSLKVERQAKQFEELDYMIAVQQETLPEIDDYLAVTTP